MRKEKKMEKFGGVGVGNNDGVRSLSGSLRK